jgi:hypothetical protein
MVLNLWLKLASIVLVILDAPVEAVTALTRQSVDDEFLGVTTSQCDIDFALQDKDDAVKVIALVVNQVVLRVEELLHLVSQLSDDFLVWFWEHGRLVWVVVSMSRLHKIILLVIISIPICIAQDGRFLVRIVSLNHLSSVSPIEVSFVQIIS